MIYLQLYDPGTKIVIFSLRRQKNQFSSQEY